MSNGKFGIVIRTAMLSRLRNFYRDVLLLGEPVVDSRFWVEFQVTPELRLILEQSEAPYLVHESAATALVVDSPDALTIYRELCSRGYAADPVEEIATGERLYRCLDPENNVFYLCMPAAGADVPGEPLGSGGK